jgi:hypothetical protein
VKRDCKANKVQKGQRVPKEMKDRQERLVQRDLKDHQGPMELMVWTESNAGT